MQVSQVAAWFVAVVLVEAAIIDGFKLRVPNWLTYHLAFGGLVWAGYSGGAEGLMWSLEGLALGLLLLMPLYAIGGMGAGDVKLMAGVGAWIGPALVFGSFVATGLVGGLIGFVMMALSRNFRGHLDGMMRIGQEIVVVRDAVALSEMAARRKPMMLLLPYGIPMAIGTIGFLAVQGLF